MSFSYKPAYIWNGTTWDQIGNQAVASLDDYALLDPSLGQTINNTELTNATLTAPEINGGEINDSLANSIVLKSPEEKITISASAATGTVDFDCLTQGILYYTDNASANFTLNFRGDSTTTMNDILDTGQTFTASFLNTNGASAFYPTDFQVDGSAVTPKWSGGSAPTSGNSNSVDAYSFTIVKTANATFTIFAGAVQFA